MGTGEGWRKVGLEGDLGSEVTDLLGVRTEEGKREIVGEARWVEELDR
jgi:hypothetical protein